MRKSLVACPEGVDVTGASVVKGAGLTGAFVSGPETLNKESRLDGTPEGKEDASFGDGARFDGLFVDMDPSGAGFAPGVGPRDTGRPI